MSRFSLPQSWRFVIYNNTGVALEFSSNSANETLTIEYAQANIDPSAGVADHDGTLTSVSASTDLSNQGIETLGGADGEDDLDMFGTISVTTDNSSASGGVVLGVEMRPTSSGSFPSAAGGYDPASQINQIAVVNLSGAETNSDDFVV